MIAVCFAGGYLLAHVAGPADRLQEHVAGGAPAPRVRAVDLLEALGHRLRGLDAAAGLRVGVEDVARPGAAIFKGLVDSQ
jgi:hypothetical protein